jgi:hypothetical protein
MMMGNEMKKRDEVKEKIKRLLFEQDAVEKLRNFALWLYAEGFSEKEIYQIYLESDIELQNDGTEELLIETLEEVMDMMVGWYPCRNIDFANESYKGSE